MKVSSRNMLVLLAVVVSFVAVQAVSAAVVSGPYTIEGTIVEMLGDGLVINVGEDETVNVYGMGPATYWASQGVDFPKVGDEVTIVAYWMEDDKYVAVSIDNLTQNTYIELREVVYDSAGDEHLIPLWSKSKKLSATETAVFSTTDADCTCDCKGDCDGDACDCTCDCDDCLEKQNQYRNGKDQ